MHTLPPIPSLLFYFTHIYIFFGKSRLLRLAILLPDRKNKRQLKLYLKERKDIFFIFFLIFLNFYYFKYCLGWRGPQWPAHPCCNLNCCFVFWYVVLWLFSKLRLLHWIFFFFSVDPFRILFFFIGGTLSFRNRFLGSWEVHWDLVILDSLLIFLFFLWWNTSSWEVLTSEFFPFVVSQEEEFAELCLSELHTLHSHEQRYQKPVTEQDALMPKLLSSFHIYLLTISTMVERAK